MRRVLAAVLLAVAALLTGPAPAGAETVVLDGVSVALREGTRQVVTVNHTRGTYARVTYWRRVGGSWDPILRTTGRTGYGGLVPGDERVQGSGTTPLGTYRLLFSFGTHRRGDNADLTHRRIRRGDFWVMDNRSAYYNRYRNQRDGGFRWWLTSGVNASERLTDYPVQYEYAIVIGYNWEQVRYRGTGIFLHVDGRGATAGCVSAPRWFLRQLFGRLDPDLRPVIAIGR